MSSSDEAVESTPDPPFLPLANKSIQKARFTFWQRISGSDFIRKVAETYLTQILLILVGLVTTIVVTRSLGPQGRGLYAVALAIGLVGMQFGHFGMMSSNTYYLGQNRALLPQLLANSVALSFLVGIALSAIFGGLFFLRPTWAPVQGRLLVLGFAYIPFGLSFLLLENLLLGLQQVRAYNKLELMNRILNLACIGAVILSRQVRAENILAASVFVLIVSNVLAASMLKPFVTARVRPALSMFRSTFGVGIRAYVIVLFSFLLLRIDLLMVKYLLGAEQAGYYSVASSMADYALMLPSVISMILFPKLAAMRSTKQKLAQARRATTGTAFALVPILLVAGFGARAIIRIAFGKSFIAAGSAFLWLIPGIFSMGVEVVAVQFLNSIGYPKSVIWVWVASVALNILGNFWAIPHMGIEGASMMSSISYTLTMLAIFAIIASNTRKLLPADVS